ncbi:MAG: 4-hydroxy-tetrahydrodipicolinate synthase [Candidatus Lokiarchaeota archaeon]|nr:4-hydroxy-tetrahydrodipicolinate synthase [Candidatus Lokiarchaeota archaeon]
MVDISKCFVAMITPLDENREVVEEDLRTWVDYLIKNGVHGLVPMGTTGESATMSHNEHKRIIEIVVNQTKNRVPVIAGSGSNSTREAIDLSKFAENAGADGCLVIVPYYNKPMQSGLLAHFTKVAESVKVPIVLYNVPSRTGRNLEADTVIKLSKIKNIVAIKEASGDLDQIMRIVKGTDEDFSIISGDDSLTYSICTIGGKGVISVAGNIIPKKMSDLCISLEKGDYQTALKQHYELYDLLKVLFVESNPIPVKEAAKLLKIAGISNWNLRLPLLNAAPDTIEKIKKVLKELKLL